MFYALERGRQFGFGFRGAMLRHAHSNNSRGDFDATFDGFDLRPRGTFVNSRTIHDSWIGEIQHRRRLIQCGGSDGTVSLATEFTRTRTQTQNENNMLSFPG